MNDYTPLEKHLATSGEEIIVLTFDEIGRIIGSELPPSAKKYPAWWSNVGSNQTAHSHAYSWYNAGYKVSPRFRENKAIFTKLSVSPNTVTKNVHNNKAYSHAAPSEQAETHRVIGSDDKQISVCGYPFQFIQRLIPDCKNGTVIKYYPQKDYTSRDDLPLARHGKGAFCHFTINAPASAGVYLWVVSEEVIYIGETQNLAQRFNMGYGNISPRNCYIGGQSTNCKMNKIVMEYYEKQAPIELYFYETNQYKQVELELLRHYNTKYNVKDN